MINNSLSKPRFAIKTNDDMQMLLVTLLIVFVVGVKCYMMVIPKNADTLQQKNKSYAVTNTPGAVNYPQQ